MVTQLPRAEFGRQRTSVRTRAARCLLGKHCLKQGQTESGRRGHVSVLCTHTAVLLTQYTSVVGNSCSSWFYMGKLQECFCWFQNTTPRNPLGSWAGLPHGWVLQNGWTPIQENIPWSRVVWNLQPRDGTNPLTPCNTILFNPIDLPVWHCWRMKQETSWYCHTNPGHFEYCRENLHHRAITTVDLDKE